jgi:CTP synthase
MKYILVTGGVISSIGKGITSSSIGLILKSFGYTITAIKIDPYLNIDAGLMSPGEHGECYVLEDGSECDLDLGNYERFLDINLTKDHNITTGKIYNNVISKERHGKYLGKSIQIVPHLTNEIQSWIDYTSKLPINNKTPDFCIIEIGGTIGDMENAPFVEAIRQMSLNQEHQFCFIHVSLIIDNQEQASVST